MFFLGSIRSWWVSRKRDLFVYWDGTKTRRADPLRISGLLDKHCPNYLELLQAAVHDTKKDPVGPIRDEAVKKKLEAAASLAQAAFRIFDVKPLTDTEGVTDGEALGILTMYFVFMERLAEDAKLFKDWQPAG